MSGEARVAGHFGEWLQGRLGRDGPVVLVTVACPALAVTVRLRPARLAVEGPAAALLPTSRARRLLATLGLPETGEIRVEAEMPPGGGAGASTAALVALARAAGSRAAPECLAAACLAVEGATDPLMLRHPDRHLWASREGRSVEPLPPPPPLEVVGGFFGPPLRTDPADLDLPDIADLVAPWRQAAQAGDAVAAARLATVSAARTTARRGPACDPTAGLAAALGALGHVRAHTGSARGLLFAPGTAPQGVEARLAAAGLTGLLRFRSGGAA